MLLSIFLALWALPLQATPAPDTIPGNKALFQSEPPRPAWMHEDKLLQTPVTLEAKGRSLRVVFSALSKQSGLTIHTARDLEEFRVVINVRAQPLWKFMAHLEDLFGHGQVPSRSCVWQRSEQAGKISYFFARTQRGREEEEGELNRSLQIALNRLRGRRDYERLSPEQRRLLQSSDPNLQYKVRQGRPLSNDKEGLIYKAVAALTDDQIKTLGQTGSVSVPDFTVPSETVAWMREKNPPIVNPLAVNRDMRPPSDAVLTLGRQEAWKGMYAVNLNFLSGSPSQLPGWIGLDTLDFFASEEALDEAANAEAGPVIDLLSEVKGKPGQKPLVSLPSALNLLARKAHINIYAETFVHPQQVLRFPKGSPTYLLTHLCADFGYRWLKVGTEYLVYSKSWAEDRAADISQPELERIIAKRALQGHYELKDYIEMARKNDMQLKKLGQVLGISGPFEGGNKNAIRLLNAFSMDDLPVAYTEQGALLTELTPAYAADLQAVFRQRLVTPPIRVKLVASANGVGIQFADQEGKSHEWWAYQGNKPGGRSFMPKQLSLLEADGSYPPSWGTASQ